MSEHVYFVYVMSNFLDTVLYIGVTNNLQRRVLEHRQKTTQGFTSKYQCEKLVYYEQTTDICSAIEREKQLKKWSRKKKEILIDRLNSKRSDLSEELL